MAEVPVADWPSPVVFQEIKKLFTARPLSSLDSWHLA